MFFWNRLTGQAEQSRREVLKNSLQENLRRFKEDYFHNVETVMYREFRTAPTPGS